MIAAHAVTAQGPCAMIWGGETIVHLHGHGKGGRNQEVALGAAQTLAGQANACVLAAGSDGTDGPPDADWWMAHFLPRQARKPSLKAWRITTLIPCSSSTTRCLSPAPRAPM